MRDLLILGMHRSGTSMVANILEEAGIYVGDQADLLDSQADNPRGFWERRDVVELNDEILASVNASWYKPPREEMEEEGEFAAAIQQILSKFPADKSALIKDPRLVLTLPQWLPQLSNPVLLIVYREPGSIAQSLKKRNSFPALLSIALWEHYNRLTLSYAEEVDSVFISYEELVQRPEKTILKLISKLKSLQVECSLPENLSFYDASLNHSKSEHQEKIEELLTTEQQSLQSYFQEICSGRVPSSLPLEGSSSSEFIKHDLAESFGELSRLSLFQQVDTELKERTKERDKCLSQLKETEESLLKREGEHQAWKEERYEKVIQFSGSTLGKLQFAMAKFYKLLTGRRNKSTVIEDLLEEAQSYKKNNGIAVVDPSPGKLTLLKNILLYVVQNPAGSLRSISLPRIKRAVAVLFSSSAEDLEVWVRGRFPQRSGTDISHLLDNLDDRYDKLELSFADTNSPQVSIVIPVYNQYRMTVQCLESVLEHSKGIDYEVIIADDCSTDLTQSIQSRIKNIKVIRGETNQGFVKNCNTAAAEARGDFILLLNNDTSVTAGWLEKLLDAMDSNPNAGLVGPKLLFANGKLQEAGGIVWEDGSAWNFGRMDAPEKPDYNYKKSCDYISGACLLIRSSLWQEIKGFDEQYAPAYYEDTDLAFEVRARGWQVLYQPQSVVYHFEGVSNGSDLEQGLKQYQRRNQAIFLEKWQSELQEFHFENAQEVFYARDRSRNQRTILIIDHYVPHYDKDAGSRSTFMYIKLMVSMGYNVKFMGANFFAHQPYTQVLQDLGVEVLVGEYMARNQDRWLQENARYIDRIYLHRPHIAEQVLDSLHKMEPRPEIIYFGHDLHYMRFNRELSLKGGKQLEKEAKDWRQREYAVFDRVDKIYYPSQVEVDEVRSQLPQAEVRAIPLYAVSLDGSATKTSQYKFDSRRDILFVGGFNHPPNVDGICWFAREVLPLVAEVCPGIRLHIVGSNPTDEVRSLQSEQVQVYGYLSDEELNHMYSEIRQVVVPLRFGAGVKGKVIEALQQGAPLVTTDIGAEGIPEAEKVMHIANDAEGFARHVIAINKGEEQHLAKLDDYNAYLQQYFSEKAVEIILREDFGEPYLKVASS